MLDKDVLTGIISNKGHNKELTPYLMFKYAIKTEITRRYNKSLASIRKLI